MDDGVRIWRWTFLAALAALGATAFLTPAPLPTDADPDVFSAERAFRHIETIAAEPHAMGSAEIVEVRQYLVGTIETLGLDPVTQRTTAQDYFGAPGRTVDVVNVMARIPGEASTGAIVLMGHYDTDPATPGANDNAAAVAAILEAARWLGTQEPLKNDVIMLFTDGEEPAPRFGATAFVQEHPWMADVGLVVNLEAIGGSGPSVTIETSGQAGWLIGRFADASLYPAAHSFAPGLNELLSANATDFTPFAEAGVPGLNFAYLHGSPIYHTADDSLDNVSLRSLQHHGEHLLSVLRAFGDEDLTQAQGEDRTTFFSVGGAFVVRYNATAAVVLLIAASLFIGAAVTSRPRRFLTDAGMMLLKGLGMAVIGAILWRIIVAVRSTPAVWESYLYLAVMAAGATLLYLRWTKPDTGSLTGAALAWLVMGALLTIVALPTAYVFVLPAFAGGAIAAWTVRWPPLTGRQRLAALVIVAAPTSVVAIPIIDLLYQFAQPRPGNAGSQLLDVTGFVVLMIVMIVALLRPLILEGEAPAAALRPGSPLQTQRRSAADQGRRGAGRPAAAPPAARSR